MSEDKKKEKAKGIENQRDKTTFEKLTIYDPVSEAIRNVERLSGLAMNREIDYAFRQIEKDRQMIESALKTHNDIAMESYRLSTARLEEMYKSAYTPMQDILGIKGLMDSQFGTMRDALAHIESEYRSIADLESLYIKQNEYIKATFEDLTSLTRDHFAEEIKKASGILSKNSIYTMSESIDKFYSSFSYSAYKQFTTDLSFSALRDIFPDIELQPLAVSSDGTVELSGTVVSIEDVQEQLKAVVDSAIYSVSGGFDGIFQAILVELQKREPFWQKILFYVVIPLVYLILGQYLQSCLQNSKSQSQEKRIINNHINIYVTQQSYGNVKALSELRYVNSDVLYIMQSPSRSSKIIAELSHGEAVRIIKKEKNWSLIEWNSEESTIRGWVFSRYLSKFRLKYPHSIKDAGKYRELD